MLKILESFDIWTIFFPQIHVKLPFLTLQRVPMVKVRQLFGWYICQFSRFILISVMCFMILSHITAQPPLCVVTFSKILLFKFGKLAFRHAGACLTLLRKIWEEWKKELMKEWHTLGLFNNRNEICPAFLSLDWYLGQFLKLTDHKMHSSRNRKQILFITDYFIPCASLEIKRLFILKNIIVKKIVIEIKRNKLS